jgi:hypothetical protein
LSGSPLDHALAYTNHGLGVIPLWPERKIPHASRKYPGAALLGAGFDLDTAGTTDPKVIRGWWEREPDAGVGIVCGWRSEFMPIDVDNHGKIDVVTGEVIRGGDSFLRWIEELRNEEGLELPPCPVVGTPRGGLHLWGRVRGRTRLTSREFVPGVEILGSDHWIAAPPTEVLSGVALAGYRFLTEPAGVIPDWPDWLLDATLRRRRVRLHRSSGITERVAVDLGGVRPEGHMPTDAEFAEHGLGWWWNPTSRNRDAYELAFRAWCRHGNEQRVVGIVYRAWQATADQSGSSWDEICGCIESAGGRWRDQQHEVAVA